MQEHMRTSPIKVTLKCIKNSQEISDEYLKRVRYIRYYVAIMYKLLLISLDFLFS